MSNIVTLKPDQRGRVYSDLGAERGHILLFTGVRYIRDAATSDAPVDPQTVLDEALAPCDTTVTERLKA